MKLKRNSSSFNNNFLHELPSIQTNSSGHSSFLCKFKDIPNCITNVLYLTMADFISSDKSDILPFGDIVNEIRSFFQNCSAALLKYRVYTRRLPREISEMFCSIPFVA